LQSENFIIGKDASLEFSIGTMHQRMNAEEATEVAADADA
jgi:hypothetical protein